MQKIIDTMKIILTNLTEQAQGINYHYHYIFYFGSILVVIIYEEQREQLWLNKLDKEERYILGIKIDISKDEKNYEDRLNYARKINKELGYGTNELNNDEEEYKKLREKIAYLTYRKKIEKNNKKFGNIKKK